MSSFDELPSQHKGGEETERQGSCPPAVAVGW